MNEPITLRSSSLTALELCTARFHLSKLAPELPESEEATSGTRVHAAMAGTLSFDELTSDEQQTMEMLTRAYDFITEGMTDPVRYVEQDFRLAHPMGTVTGHPDLIEIRGEHCLVIDWKTGRNECPHASENLQLLTYALMVAATHEEPQTFELHIVQPWAKGGGSSAVLRREELSGAWHRITEIFERIQSQEEGPNPSEEACRYCNAQTICPKQRQQLAQVARYDIAPERLELCTPTELVALYDACGEAERVSGHIKSFIKRKLEENPSACGGVLYLKPGAVQTKITDSAGLYGRLARECSLTAEDFLPCVSVAKTKLAPVVKKKSKLKGKEFDAWFSATLAPFVDEKQNQPSVERRK